jgi:hypothetical protein
LKFFETQSNDPFAAVGSTFLGPEEFDGRLHQGNLARVFMKILDDEIADILIRYGIQHLRLKSRSLKFGVCIVDFFASPNLK